MNVRGVLIRIADFFKPVAGALIIVTLLQVTGIMSDISVFTQTAALSTGLLDATPEADVRRDDFNFDFKIKDLAGNKIDFTAYKGKVVFLNLWATWCGPCRAEMPTIQKLYDKVDKEKIVFVMLSIDQDKNKEKVEQYVKKGSFTFPVFMPTGHLPAQLQVPSIPTTFVLAKDGKILTKEVGTANYDTDKFRKFLETEASK